MILINFAHPLTEEQKKQLINFGIVPRKIVEVKTQLDLQEPLTSQVEKLVDEVGLSSEEWQGEAIVVNLPGLAPAAGILLAVLHGRMGHFPLIMRLSPTPTGQYEVAEVVNLQAVRDAARLRR